MDKIIRTFLFFTTIMSSAFNFSQEIKLGVNLSTNAFQRHILEGESYKPEGSYFTYYPEGLNSNLIVDQFKTFNSISLGANARFSRKQLGLVFEPQLTMELNNFKFTSPYYSNRILNRRAFRFPLILTYHLIKNINSIYAIGGAMFVAENNFDFQQLSQQFYFGSEDPYETNPDFGANHFQSVFYDNSLRYNYIVGLGKKSGDFDISARYVNTLTPQKYLGKKWQIELNIAYYFLSNKDLTRKNYLYEE